MRYAVLALILPLAACGSGATAKGDPVAPQGSGGSRSFQVADFTGVELAGADDVDVRVGGAFAVRAEGPAEELDKLDIRKDGAMLRVGRKRQTGWNSSRGVKVYVTMPAIRAASLAGSGDMAVDRASGEAFAGALAGSGNLRVGQLAVRSTKFELAGSGNVGVGGTTEALSISIAGSGNVEAAGLTARNANISIAGSGNVAATVNGPADVTVMGSGDVALDGNAQCKSTKMGSGEIRCGR